MKWNFIFFKNDPPPALSMSFKHGAVIMFEHLQFNT